VRGSCALGDALFAVARDVDDFASERHLVVGTPQQWRREKQRQRQKSGVPAHR